MDAVGSGKTVSTIQEMVVEKLEKAQRKAMRIRKDWKTFLVMEDSRSSIYLGYQKDI